MGTGRVSPKAPAARNAERVLELRGEVERLQTEDEALRKRLADCQRMRGCDRCSDMKPGGSATPTGHEQRPG